MDETLSLNQGRYHKSRKFQRESFTNITNTVATATDPTVPNVSTDPDTQEAFDLQAKMEDLLNRLQKAQTDQASFTDKFTNSTDSSKNKYLNNNVHFSNENRYGYVTNQSELKMYPEINDNYIYKANQGKHGCPNNEPIEINVSFPLQPKLGQSIELETGIFVVLGLPITKVGESCGFEGRNVYVDKLITNTTATYQGCYADNNGSWTTMSFIGGSPPVEETFITNKNFSQSHLANDSYKYLTWDTITVPGWNFNCVLVNNSTAWGYPIPYPNGNQCACIQTTQELWTANWMSFSSGVTYTISFDACGRNCCDGSGEANPINIGLEDNTFYSFNPPVNKWTNYSTTFTVDSQQNMRLSFKGTWTASDRSTAIQNVSINKGASSNSGGTYTYDMCKQAAIDNGYQYFALQDVNTEKKTGYCAVANNNIWPTRYGESKIPESTTAIWSSKTTKNSEISGSGGKYAKLTSTGSLTVYNATDAVIFTTTIPEDQTSGYIGCYADRSSRAMPNISNNKYIEIEDCHQLAIDNNLKYYALQDVKQARDENNNLVGIGWCAGSNDLSQSQKYGKANCGPMSSTDNRIGGRGWSNAIYSTSPDSPHYLILQADGNMCIYKGSRIFNQGIVWDSMQDTENIIGEYKLQDPNPSKSAAMGKFKRNYITNDDDQILEVGDFIGSPDGSTFLIMQDDGNLVLYTTKLVTNCLKLDSNNYEDIYGGGIGANALYKLDEVAFPSNMGKYGYVNGGSRVSEYPADMLTMGYNTITNAFMSGGSGLTNWINGNADDAKTACNATLGCGQVIMMNQQPTYVLTQSGKYNNNSNSYNSYIKSKTLDTTKINSSCNSQDPISIDTIQWEHYLKGLPMTPETTCSITKLETLQNKTMDDLKIQLAEVSSQLVEKLNKIEVKNNSMNTQMDSGGKQIRIDVKKYKENAQKILTYSKSMNPRRKNDSQTLEGFNVLNNNIDYMVADSNIVSTQGVYSYIIWSVIATVTVIITIELFTNERNTPLWKLVFLSVIIIIMNGLFREYALLVNILIVIMFVVRKKFKLMAKENNNI